jgi:pyrroline-5-carboxylate reductase
MSADPGFPLAVGFLGAGQMASALAVGWTKAGLLDVARSRAADPYPEVRDRFEKATGVQAVPTNAVVATLCDVLVVAVKPHVVPDVLAELKPALEPRHLVISIAAGVTLATLLDGLGGFRRVARVMPNTPCLVGASASAFAGSTGATEADLQLVERLLNSVGRCVQVPEKWLDAVTGLSGSGPAFVAMVVEALADGGVRMGLPRDLALLLSTQTVFGSAKMLLETGLHPAQLKDQVASPGGTTIAGLHELERGGLRAALMDAVEAATERSIELGK